MLSPWMGPSVPRARFLLLPVLLLLCRLLAASGCSIACPPSDSRGESNPASLPLPIYTTVPLPGPGPGGGGGGGGMLLTYREMRKRKNREAANKSRLKRKHCLDRLSTQVLYAAPGHLACVMSGDQRHESMGRDGYT
jgi:hypothetical protein